MNNLIQFKDLDDLSKGLRIDLEQATFEDVMLFFSETEQLVSNFTDAFVMMGLPLQEAESAGLEMYTKTRRAIENFINKKLSNPITYTHASAFPLQ